MTITGQEGTLLAKNATQAIDNAADVTFSSATTDDDTLFSVGSPTIITVGSSAWHAIVANIRFSAGVGSARVQLRVNGAVIEVPMVVVLSPTEETSCSLSARRSLSATDTVSVLVTPLTGSPVVAAGSTLAVTY